MSRKNGYILHVALSFSVLMLPIATSVHADEDPTPTATPAAKGTPTAKSLADLAREMQQKKAAETEGGAATTKKIVITNENLADYADKGNVTTAKPAVVPAPQLPQSDRSGDEVDEKREYWRTKYSEQLALIASLEGELARLDSEIPKLWSDFYSRDDPAYRDGVIKPKLDEALVRRQNVEEQLETEREKPQQILIDARKDGAQPGWFRDLQ